jgi:hypothetical protein
MCAPRARIWGRARAIQARLESVMPDTIGGDSKGIRRCDAKAARQPATR